MVDKHQKAVLTNRIDINTATSEHLQLLEIGDTAVLAVIEYRQQQPFRSVKDLRKVYDNGFRAVDGINCRMYEGQIFALLGHTSVRALSVASSRHDWRRRGEVALFCWPPAL